MIDEQTCREARRAQASRCELFEEIEDDELEVTKKQLAEAQQTISAQAAQIATLERQVDYLEILTRKVDRGF